ncbi:transposable element Tcb2 transposase [Trichonephila clavipes]|nr:transposable element Tcb2 transposase [Trichonephila clavipes]
MPTVPKWNVCCALLRGPQVCVGSIVALSLPSGAALNNKRLSIAGYAVKKVCGGEVKGLMHAGSIETQSSRCDERESRFNLSSDDNRVRVWRPRGERLNPAFALQRHTSPTVGVMVWGVIAYNTRSPLVLIRGTMTAQRYVHDILLPHVLLLMQRFPGAIFQQDNGRPHTARVSQDCLRTITTLPWPARSPDLSPIEHIWDHLEWRVWHPTSLNELDARLKYIWNGMSQDIIRNLYTSMPDRIASCIGTRGGSTGHSQVRKTKPELAPVSKLLHHANWTTLILGLFNGQRLLPLPYTEGIQRHWVRTHDTPATSRSPLGNLYWVAGVAEWYRYQTVACLVTSSRPVPLKTRRVGQRCMLNMSRAKTSSRWCGVVVRRGGASSSVVHVT